jgi:hypothetical protein
MQDDTSNTMKMFQHSRTRCGTINSYNDHSCYGMNYSLSQKKNSTIQTLSQKKHPYNQQDRVAGPSGTHSLGKKKYPRLP